MPAPVLRTSQAPEQQITLPFRMKPTEGNQIAAVDTKGGMEEETRSKRINAAEHQERLSTKPKAVASLREELLTHSRYIRDHLFPALSRAPKLSQSDLATLNSIFKLLRSLAVTFDILRFSRMEKALQLIVANGASVWPTEVVIQAEYTLRKWEDKLGHGSLKNLRANLWGPGGRLEGIRRIKDSRHRDDDAVTSWEVEGAEASNSAQCGDLGFEVGHWWLKEAAAFRDGIIDETSHAITADENGAYAIVLSGNCEQNLLPNGSFQYHALKGEPNGFMLSKTMTKTDPEEKVVRVLRSWRLRSKLAPKGGVRYDGLYRIIGYGFKPRTWQIYVSLWRIPDQPPIQSTLHADMLNDWKDYQHFKNTDRGEDFAVLRDILQDETQDKDIKDEKPEPPKRQDSGYFSNRASGLVDQALLTGPESHPEINLVLFAEGTPPSGSETGTPNLAVDGALELPVTFPKAKAIKALVDPQAVESVASEDIRLYCASKASTTSKVTAFKKGPGITNRHRAPFTLDGTNESYFQPFPNLLDPDSSEHGKQIEFEKMIHRIQKEPRIKDIWRRISKKPDSYVKEKEELTVFLAHYPTLGGPTNQVAKNAVARFWNKFRGIEDVEAREEFVEFLKDNGERLLGIYAEGTEGEELEICLVGMGMDTSDRDVSKGMLGGEESGDELDVFDARYAVNRFWKDKDRGEEGKLRGKGEEEEEWVGGDPRWLMGMRMGIEMGGYEANPNELRLCDEGVGYDIAAEFIH